MGDIKPDYGGQKKWLEHVGCHEGFVFAVCTIHLGYRAGYVQIPSSHPWYERGDLIPDDVSDAVHGGITYARGDSPVLPPGWWIGFDCGHHDDGVDPDLMSPVQRRLDAKHGSMGSEIDPVRSLDYVIEECKKLATHAARAARGNVVGTR
jgi:hypothetical protein